MAEARSFTALAGQFTKVTTAVEKSQRKGIERAAFAAKQEFLAAPGAPRFLKGVGTRGARTNVRYDIKGQRNPTALVRWVGPAHLVNNPTKPHEIMPRRRRGRRGKKAVLIDGQPRARAQHPGTRGKGFFEKGRDRAAIVAPREFFNTVTNAIGDALR